MTAPSGRANGASGISGIILLPAREGGHSGVWAAREIGTMGM